MSLTCVKKMKFDNNECKKILVSIWKNDDTNEISLEIEQTYTLDCVEIGNVNDVRQLNCILTHLIEIMDKLDEGSV